MGCLEEEVVMEMDDKVGMENQRFPMMSFASEVTVGDFEGCSRNTYCTT